MADDGKYGFIVMDGRSTLFGILSGNFRRVLCVFSIELALQEFAWLGIEEGVGYVQKTGEISNELYIDNTTENPDVVGLIIASPSEYKFELLASNTFDQQLKDKVVNVVDVPSGGVAGFHVAIEMSSGVLWDVRFIQEKRLLKRFIDEVCRNSGRCVIGVENTLRALEMGAVETMIMWENLDINRYELKHSGSGEMIVKHLDKMQEADRGNFIDPLTGAELKVQQKIPLLGWVQNKFKSDCTFELFSEGSDEGYMFWKGFGGIGASLRCQLVPDFGKLIVDQVHQTSKFGVSQVSNIISPSPVDASICNPKKRKEPDVI